MYTSPILDTAELKKALWALKVSGAFEKRAPGIPRSIFHLLLYVIQTLKTCLRVSQIPYVHKAV